VTTSAGDKVRRPRNGVYGRVVGQVSGAVRLDPNKKAAYGAVADDRAADAHAYTGPTGIQGGVASHYPGGVNPDGATVGAGHVIIGYYARGQNLGRKGSTAYDSVSPHDPLGAYPVANRENPQVLNNTAFSAVN
jgi:hypothetical protein